jgi:2-oxoglutarate dehydrogenase E1 component
VNLRPGDDRPANVTLHRQIVRVVQDREKMAAGQLPLDWGMAETLAYATLLTEGYEVRISGQDSGRGTFFHRHAVWHDQTTGSAYVPLKTIAHSHVSRSSTAVVEEAVMGFEYGFSTTSPTSDHLGRPVRDFANNARSSSPIHQLGKPSGSSVA